MEEIKKLTDEQLDQVTGGVNWPCFGTCIIQHGGGAIPALAELTAAIRSKDWGKVAKLAGQSVVADLPLVANCLSSC